MDVDAPVDSQVLSVLYTCACRPDSRRSVAALTGAGNHGNGRSQPYRGVSVRGQQNTHTFATIHSPRVYPSPLGFTIVPELQQCRCLLGGADKMLE